MRLLCLDLRNGSLSFGVRDALAAGPEGPWLLRRRLGTGGGRSADEYGQLFRALCVDGESRPVKPEAAILSSVAPHLTPVVCAACARAFGLDPLIVGPGVKTGLKIRTDQPSELGTDLVAMAVAALDLVKADCIVVNLGRILTISAVSGSGEFLGAAIAPGPLAALDSLRSESALLPLAPLEKPRRAIGKNSPSALSAGIMLGLEGLLDRLVERMAQEAGWKAVLVGTGEEEQPILEPTGGFRVYDPWLSLDGLSLIHAATAGR